MLHLVEASRARRARRSRAVAWLVAACLLAPGAVARCAEQRPPSAWAAGLTLVDRLGWADTDAAVEAFVARAHAPDAVFAASWRRGWAGRAGRLADAPVYAVELRIADGERWLSLREAIVWTNRAEAPVDTIVLRYPPLTSFPPSSLGVWIDGRRADASVDGAVIRVPLPDPLDRGERVRLLVEVPHQVLPVFRGGDDDPEGDAISAMGTGAFGRSRGVLNLGYALALVTAQAPDGSFDARPMPTHGEHAFYDPAQMHVVVDAPSKLLLASSGVELESRTAGERTTTRIVAAGARDFALEASAVFGVATAEVDGIRVRAFHRQWEPDSGAALLAHAVGALRFYEALWGELPYRELDVVDAPVRVALGLEFPQLVTVDLPSRFGAEDFGAIGTIAHEVAHQWWHAEVGNDPWGEPWLDEALASQASELYVASLLGPERAAVRRERLFVGPLRAVTERQPATLEAGRYALPDYARLIYVKAPLFLERVRALLGDDAYHGALRRYHRDFRLRTARGADLIDRLRSAGADPAAIDATYRRWMIEVHPIDTLLE